LVVKSWKQVEWRKNKACKAGRKCKKGREVFVYVRVVSVKDRHCYYEWCLHIH